MLGRPNRKSDELIEVLGNFCGVGLWDAVLVNEDALHPKSQWTWTNEFRRLVGYSNETDFPNVCQSWSDKMHPEDAPGVFAAFNAALKKVPGKKSVFEARYRLKMKDGSYRWFRATGGIVHDASGKAVRACGALVDVQDATLAAQKAKAQAEAMSTLTTTFEREMSALTEKVAGAATELESTAQQLSASANQTTGQSNAVSTAAEEAGANVAAVAGAAEELGSSVAEIRRQVERSAGMSKEAVREADATAGIVSELRAVAASIGAVVDMINGLAAQTNLLALNATIEAARAGDAGKGFAVVAAEVKALANETAKATAEISGKVNAIQSTTDKAVDAIGGISGTIREIDAAAGEMFLSIAQQSQATNEIVGAVNLASSGTREVTHNIVSVARTAEETGSAAGHVLSASGELSEQAAQMRGQVRGFLDGMRRVL
ncbi:chemotaxis protein [Azorhizobium oxalatiphilum]|uniref:Chemotaxis protein n=1 Tax=Azorhizobium oxalatiphilum TaxID=980631 RepID=A0A917C8R1_9HYPH|nr:methyl-accepting chemotaxis protein [Azorhizobium oxalatiphilum]GGF78421.1 chemotaxis protein [Azorhizobium oxalatiphilum]